MTIINFGIRHHIFLHSEKAFLSFPPPSPARHCHSGFAGTSDLSIWLSVDPMADKYPSTSPYTYCANNPVKLKDPDGKKVINSYKEAYDYWHKRFTIAQENLNSFGGNRKSDGYKEAKQEYKYAKRNFNSVACLYHEAASAMADVKKYNPGLYDKMDDLKDKNGNTVDVYVGLNYSKSKKGWGSIPDVPNCPERVHVALNPSACFANGETTDMGKILSHEFGHYLYIVPNWSEYQDFLNTKVNRAEHDGHDHGDESGKEADNQTLIYRKNRYGY